MKSLICIILCILSINIVINLPPINEISAQKSQNLDTFAAQGGIYTVLPLKDKNQIAQQIDKLQDEIINSDNKSKTQEQTNKLAMKNDSTLNKNNDIIKGIWNIKVLKGNIQDFGIFFAKYDSQNKVINAYSIYNLETPDYIQIDQTGNEIIKGSADFKSLGTVNETIENIPITLLISQINLFKMTIGEKIAEKHFGEQAILGQFGALVDEKGTIIVGKKK